MADIFSGIAPPNVNTTQTSTTVAPTAYNNFLSMLGSAGTSALSPDQTQKGNIAAGEPYVAPLSANQLSAFKNAGDIATTYQSPLSSAISTASSAATPVGSSQINTFYNPNVNDVNTYLENATRQNINQNVLPALQAIGASTGGTGSQRLLNATGQTLGGIQQGLSAQESANKLQAYKDAVTAALQEQQNLGQVASTQGQLASTGQTAANAAETTLANLGAQEQAQTQAQINAPLSTATNVSSLLKGYTIPTGTTQTYSGPASSYGASPLAQIAGLGSLFASGTGGTSAFEGLKKAFGLSDTSLIPSNYGNPVQGTGSNGGAGTGQIVGADGKIYADPTYGTGVPSSGIQYNGGIPTGYTMNPDQSTATNEAGDTISLF
jgi:hypothetical protein